MQYILGVEGTNENTRYMLFDVEGRFVGQLMDGTSSPETLGFEDAAHIVKTRALQLLAANRTDVTRLAGAAFGLAGVDSRQDALRFTEYLRDAGFSCCGVTNDTILGVIAGTRRGVGVCTVNSSGTATGGIDDTGTWMQVGGLGAITGDDAGGSYLAETCLRKVYDQLFRCGQETLMTDVVLRMLDLRDRRYFLDLLASKNIAGENERELSRVVFAAAEMEDEPALDILRESGRALARSTAGCVRWLEFQAPIEIVLSGGVWRKAENPVQYDAYRAELDRLITQEKTIAILSYPPILGAVLWGFRLMGADIYGTALRERVTEGVTANAVAWLDG